MASLNLWPSQPINWETRRKRLSAERLDAFNARLLALLAEYWGDLDEPVTEEPDDDLMAFATVTYRFSGEA